MGKAVLPVWSPDNNRWDRSFVEVRELRDMPGGWWSVRVSGSSRKPDGGGTGREAWAVMDCGRESEGVGWGGVEVSRGASGSSGRPVERG